MKQNKGFTLLEVLVALVILAIAFSASFLSLNAASLHLLTLQDKTAAQWVGLNVVAKAQLRQIAPHGASGTDKMFYDNWDWNLDAFPTENPHISRIVVSVHRSPSKITVAVVTGYLMRVTP